MTASDVDGDGDLDLICGNSAGNDMTVFPQDSRGAFAPEPLIVGGKGVTDFPRSVISADVDADGRLELVSANFLGHDLTLFHQVSGGAFDPDPTILRRPGITRFAVSLAAADLDSDGDLDLVSANSPFGGGSLSVFRQLVSGTFDPWPTVLRDPLLTDGPSAVVAGDLDGDGDVDLATSDLERNALTVFFGGR